MGRKDCADGVVSEDYFGVCFSGSVGKGERPKECNSAIDC